MSIITIPGYRTKSTQGSVNGTYPAEWVSPYYHGPFGWQYGYASDAPIYETRKDVDIANIATHQPSTTLFFDNVIQYQLGSSKIKRCTHLHVNWASLPSFEVGSILAQDIFDRVDLTPVTHWWSHLFSRCDGAGLLRWCATKLPPPVDIDVDVDESWLNQAALNARLPIRPDIDLTAELLQVKDLKKALSSVAKAGSWLSKLPPSLKRLKGERGRKAVISFLKDMVGADLAMKWGALPTLNMVNVVDSLVADARKRYEAFYRQVARGEQSFHSFHQTDLEVDDSGWQTYTYYVLSSNNPYVFVKLRRLTTHSGRFGYSAVQRYAGDLKQLDFSAWVRAKTGLDKPLSTVWELLPYSFVLDWFLDVDGLLSRMQSILCPIRIELEDGCITRKLVSDTTYSVQVRRLLRDNYHYPNVTLLDETIDLGVVCNLQHTRFYRESMDIQSPLLETTWRKRMFTMSELALQRL